MDLLNNIVSEEILAISIWDARIWWSIPLVLVISLVYGATRHEELREILVQAYKSAVWVVSFMLIIFAVIWVAGYWN